MEDLEFLIYIAIPVILMTMFLIGVKIFHSIENILLQLVFLITIFTTLGVWMGKTFTADINMSLKIHIAIALIIYMLDYKLIAYVFDFRQQKDMIRQIRYLGSTPDPDESYFNSIEYLKKKRKEILEFKKREKYFSAYDNEEQFYSSDEDRVLASCLLFKKHAKKLVDNMNQELERIDSVLEKFEQNINI